MLHRAECLSGRVGVKHIALHCLVLCRSAAAAADPDGSSFEVSQQRCSQLEEQVEQQQKVIRYLQAQLESSKGGGAAGPQQLQAEVERLRQQLAVLQLAASSAGGSAASALQQQVLVLQVRLKASNWHAPVTRSSARHQLCVPGTRACGTECIAVQSTALQ